MLSVSECDSGSDVKVDIVLKFMKMMELLYFKRGLHLVFSIIHNILFFLLIYCKISPVQMNRM